MSEVFVKINNRQLGPLNRREIKNLVVNGEFTQDDLVYHEDSQEWVEAREIDDLRKIFNTDQQDRQKKVYAIGGAQAVAALAYGTEPIKPVKQIFGPGNLLKAAKVVCSGYRR